MKKIIRLTESDLTRIVEKVLNEQRTSSTKDFNTADPLRNGFVSGRNINPKKLKLGDGGKNSPQKKNDVIALQKKLIDLGFLKTSTGRPTGYFGELTDAALKTAVERSQTPKTTNQSQSKPTENDSFFGKIKEICLSPFKALEALKNSFSSSSLVSLPPHWRAFMSFLMGRVEPIRANFFKPEELKLIEARVNEHFPKNTKCRRNKKCYISFYKDTDWSKVVSGQEKVVNPELGKAIGFTIGNAQVIDNGNSYTVRDIYDFNNFKNNPSAYSPENANSTVKAALEKITCGNYIQGIEELASFKQARGYKGIPVEIQIPKIV
jgi:peptidoglycan hydrolase-like protein with peptidoglycan-binding domain